MSTRNTSWTCTLGLAVLLATPAFAHVELLGPNGGETLARGSIATIEWRIAAGHDTQNWDLYYSTTGAGGPFLTIVENHPPGDIASGAVHTFDWVVPAAASCDVWVKVIQDNSGTDYEGVSASALAIGESASVALQNGSGMNSTCFSSAGGPVLGSTWNLTIDHSGHPGATFTYLVAHARGTTGTLIRAGELLVDLTSSRFLGSVVLSSGVQDVHSLQLASDPCLVGTPATFQAAIFGGGGPELCNALETVAGF